MPKHLGKAFWQRFEAVGVRGGMKLKHCCKTPLGFRKVIPTGNAMNALEPQTLLCKPQQPFNHYAAAGIKLFCTHMFCKLAKLPSNIEDYAYRILFLDRFVCIAFR